jgi:hypothetical protein
MVSNMLEFYMFIAFCAAGLFSFLFTKNTKDVKSDDNPKTFELIENKYGNYCKNCGATIRDKAKYCVNCGKKI